MPSQRPPQVSLCHHPNSLQDSSDSTHPDSLNSWFSSLPHWSTQDLKLKVAFVGPFLLRHAVSCGDVNSAKNIIKRQRSILAELSPRDAESLLRVATELADPEGMVNLLLEAGLKIDSRAKAENVSFYQVDPKWQSKGWSDLHVAIALDRTEEVLDSLDSFGPLDLRDKEGRTPLHLAASRGNIKCARVLVESGADKDAKSNDGRTALYRAAANGDRRMVEMLIEMGCDPTIADDRGRSAFDVARDKGYDEILETLERGEVVLMAARQGRLEHLESLLKKGASKNYKDQYGITALHAAAIKGHKNIVSMLVEFGVDLECQDNEGHVPLHLAVESGSLETVEVLVGRGANVNAKSNRGATPLSMAIALGYSDISEFLNGFVQLQNSISQPNLKDPNCFCFTLFHLRSEQILVPRNACRAVLELYVSFHGNDESSYSSPLSSYLRMNISLCKVMVLQEREGLDGEVHEFGGWNRQCYANLHIWLDEGSSSVTAGTVVAHNPSLALRNVELKQLDGSFEMKGKGSSESKGWGISIAGNLTLLLYGSSGSRAEELLQLFPMLLRRQGRMTKTCQTNDNLKKTNGWMPTVERQPSLAGDSNANQRLIYKDESICYSGTVADTHGILSADDLSSGCISSS
ncbi:hypothetical protein GH714_037292 [Hevea brasiliensis]|uniref:Uncharacterized protein n=1 Tax=Hevea brasiliensis TaxID=3981 RepID=A0A6A6L8B6_HEVBR|nr:hypothetical protein GH714_037292 [Hevea brasiliensis]